MGKVILDDALRAKLNGLNEVVEVCEPTGRTVGVFLPEEIYNVPPGRVGEERNSRHPRHVREREEALADYRAGRAMTTTEAIAYLKGLPHGDAGS